MTLHDAQQQLLFQLYHIYDNREAANIADWVLEHLTGWKKIDRIINKKLPLLPDTIARLETYTNQLLQHQPVQYVLQEAWFYGQPFYVDEAVLIPRPETEELVEWILQERASAAGGPVILDIGTGSGCIPVTLQLKWPAATVHGCDISEAALAVARKNALSLHANVAFHQVDFLQPASWPLLPVPDILISNPPYIPQKDQATMHANVLEHEPHLALFVPDDNPLLFYTAICRYAAAHLPMTGRIYLEIHEDMGATVSREFQQAGFEVLLKKDAQGKDRMIKAWREKS